MVSSEHLLRALIPHAVINHDVTAHLGRKGWVEPVSWAGCDAPPFSVAAARSRTCVSIMPWANSRDSFTRARLSSLESLLRAEENRSALLAVTTLRTALADGLDDVAAIAGAVCVDSDESPGCAQEVVEAAMAWLRASPVRCCLDLPCFNANRVHIQQTLSWEPRIIAALAPCVTHVHFGDSVAADAALKTLRQLPHATKVSMPVTFGDKFMNVLDHCVAENDEAAMAVARGLRFVHFPGQVARVPNPRAAEPLFPNVTSLTLGSDIGTPDVWRWVSLHRALEDLKVDHMSFDLLGHPDDEYASSPAAAAELEGAIVATFVQIGRNLRKLSITVTDYVNMTAPRILTSICEHCLNVRELTLQSVGARPGIFKDLAGLRHLRLLTLEDVEASGEAEEAADLVALPAALMHLEEFTQRDWEIAIPAAFVDTLVAHPKLTTWDASSMPCGSFTDRTRCTATASPRPFRSLRVAKLRADGALAAVALAPNLRLLSITGLDDRRQLRDITFASPYACVVTRRARAPAALLAACGLHGSGVFAMCGFLALDAMFEAADYPKLEAFPSTMRHAEFAPPPHFKSDTVPCAKELTQLLAAARNSNLESLTIQHPPDIDVAAAFSGGFRQLRSLTVLEASPSWTEALSVLRTMEDFVHSRTTALRGTVAASLLAGRNNDAPAALSARWSRRVVGLVADFCDVPTVAALSATCRDSMRAVHDTRPVPLPSMAAVDRAWAATMPRWSPHSPRHPVFDSLPTYFNAVSEMATRAADVDYGRAAILIERLHPVVAAFVESLWVQEQCAKTQSGTHQADRPPKNFHCGYESVRGVSLACAAPRRTETHAMPSKAKLCSWTAFSASVKSTLWNNEAPTWPDESPGSLAGKPVDPSTFFHDVFTSDEIESGSLHAPVLGARRPAVDYGVGCLWRREVRTSPVSNALPVEWCFVSFTGHYDSL